MKLTTTCMYVYIYIHTHTVIGSDNYVCSEPSHYLNQGWNIVNWSLRNRLQWNANWNPYVVIQGNALENVVCKISGIRSWPQYVKVRTPNSSTYPMLTSSAHKFTHNQRGHGKAGFLLAVGLWCGHVSGVHFTKLLWARNSKSQKYISLLNEHIWRNQVTTSHIPRQLSCHGKLEIVTWLGDQSKYYNKNKFCKLSIMSS